MSEQSTAAKGPNDPIVIVGAARTPMGGFQGDLSDVTAPMLGAVAIEAALARSGAPSDAVDEVLLVMLSMPPATTTSPLPALSW
ncbi:MAG: hypothetical protein AAFO62_10480, partial [Pseudomonadota bacterium]